MGSSHLWGLLNGDVVLVTQHEWWSLVDTYSGNVDIVIVRQCVQHLHHWCFYQLQCESTNTATPERTHTHTNMHDSAVFCTFYSLELQTGLGNLATHFALNSFTNCASLSLVVDVQFTWDAYHNLSLYLWFNGAENPRCYFELIMWRFGNF